MYKCPHCGFSDKPKDWKQWNQSGGEGWVSDAHVNKGCHVPRRMIVLEADLPTRKNAYVVSYLEIKSGYKSQYTL